MRDDLLNLSRQIVCTHYGSPRAASLHRQPAIVATVKDLIYEAADPGGVEPAHISEALRITFHGWYDEEEDGFKGRTFFTRRVTERPEQLSRRHKQVCGFLYLRSHRAARVRSGWNAAASSTSSCA